MYAMALSAGAQDFPERDDQGNGVPERYLLLREQMQYDNYWNILPTPENDPKYRPPWL